MFDDDSDRSSPFAMAGMMGLSFMLPFLILGMFVPFILYIIARWRDNRAPAPDPQLGLKFALAFFRVEAFQVMLIGLTMLMYSMLMKTHGSSEIREMVYRPAFGLIVPGAIVFGVASAMLPRTNQATHPMVSRIFAGYNLMISGAVGFFALIMGFELMFQKGDSGEPGRIAWSLILVYTTAWVVQGALFGRFVLDAPPPPYNEPPASPPAGGGDLPGPMQKPLA